MRPPDLTLALLAVCALAAPAAAQAVATPTAQEISIAVEKGLASEEAIVASQAEDVLLAAGPAALERLQDGLADRLGRRVALRRRRCAEILGRIGDRRALGALRLALQELRGDDELKLSAARAICRLGSSDGVRPLIDLLESADRRLRLDAFVVLRRYTHHSFNFQYDGAAAGRASAVVEWRAFWTANGASFKLVEPLSR